MKQTKKINSVSSNYVTTNTEQDITGYKHFKTNLEISTDAIDVTNPPDISTDGAKFYFLDKNNIELGSVYSGVYAENKTIKVNWSRLLAYSKDKNKAQRIEIQVAEDGKGILYAPSLVNGEDMMPVTTTAWVKSKMLDFIYPVGSIYMSVNNVSPQTFLGGTWVALKDRFLIGAGNSYAVNATGGATTHTLTVNEMPSHSHTFAGSSIGNHTHTISNVISYEGVNPKVNINHYTEDYDFTYKNVQTSNSGASGVSGSIAASGGGKAHSIMNPYLAVYMWKRTA